MGELFDGLIHYGIYQSIRPGPRSHGDPVEMGCPHRHGSRVPQQDLVNNDAPYDLPLEQPDVTHPRWGLGSFAHQQILGQGCFVRRLQRRVQQQSTGSNARNTDFDKWYPGEDSHESGMQPGHLQPDLERSRLIRYTFVTGVVES